MVDIVDDLRRLGDTGSATEEQENMLAAADVIEYLRAELEQVKRERDEAVARADRQKAAGFCDAFNLTDGEPVKCGWQRRAEAAERLAGARVVTDAMVKSITDFVCDEVLPSYGIKSGVGRNDPELPSAVRAALSALAEPAGEVEPVAWRYRYNGKWYVCDSEAVARLGWDVTPLYTTPPDASAIREAADLARACLAGLVSAGHNSPPPQPEQIETVFWELDAALAGAKP
ncbi:hypothetical protein [Aquamicrobium defluvii]|uniref:Uncharacterized protein n=1 Tax=Aquamicrobium defluvii TaxID=69279 RepID=A0A011VPH4_9HYPH|nr:hypothetical protein [Aquamicrobium defluvii]EXL10270.1 hypothetical protein BG36_07580 [Aquamicrobium defluvii]EZQ17046.1 hypothetical protein CF98_37135 [Halopseudomonas bauzanensis]